jgi:hypothetical protein
MDFLHQENAPKKSGEQSVEAMEILLPWKPKYVSARTERHTAQDLSGIPSSSANSQARAS